MSVSRRKKLFFIVLVVGSVGLAYLHYQELVRPLPGFESLEQVATDGMRYDLSRGAQYGFEFFGDDGRRFQTDYMELAETQAIEEALKRGGVTLWVGRWKSALSSDSIFTVYHMTAGDRVLIDYADMATAKERERQGAIPFVTVTSVFTAAFLLFCYRFAGRTGERSKA